MHASLIFPHYRDGDFSARGYPVRFEECPALKKPGKKATAEAKGEYRKAVKTHNLSHQGLRVIQGLRDELDRPGEEKRRMIVAVDGSLCNRTILSNTLPGTEIVGRCRKDARLCFPAPEGGRRVYHHERFSPEMVRHNDSIPWRTCRVHFGSAWRTIRYKEVPDLLWQRGAGRRFLRLFVVAPLPYRTSVNARKNYRDPAYLLNTDFQSDACTLLQCYFDRWQIESS
jgi:hypothetical protein